MSNFILAPSILSADFARMGDQLEAIAEGGAKYVHLDIMDGHFVPNISFGIPVVASLKNEVFNRGLNLIFDVHLMISNPEGYAKTFVEAGADIITIHYEACKDDTNTGRIIDMIKYYGVQVGLAINPDTPVERVFPFVDKIDMALIMSVRPGFGGQSFIGTSLDKARTLREYAPELDIQMDGGINLENFRDVVNAGANVVVAGSAIFHEADIVAATQAFFGAENVYV